MLESILFPLIFLVGVLAQSFVVLKNKMRFPFFIIAFISLLIFGIIGSLFSQKEFSFPNILWFSILSFAPILYLNYKKYFIPSINGKTLFVFTLVFWYVFLFMIEKASILKIVLLFAGLFFSLFMFIFLIRGERNNKIIEAILFVWYFIIIILISVLHVSNSIILAPFLGSSEIISQGASFIEFFIVGMFYMFIITNLFSIFLLVPTKRNNIDDIKEHVNLLSEKFVSSQISWVKVITIILVMGLTFITNRLFNLISDVVIIDAVILVIPWILTNFLLEKGDSIDSLNED